MSGVSKIVKQGAYIVYEGKYKGKYVSCDIQNQFDYKNEVFTINFADTNKRSLFSKPNIVSVDISEISEMEYSLQDNHSDEFGYKIANANGDFSYLEPFEKVTKEDFIGHHLEEANLIVITWKDGEKSYIGVDLSSMLSGMSYNDTLYLQTYWIDLFHFVDNWYAQYLDHKNYLDNLVTH